MAASMRSVAARSMSLTFKVGSWLVILFPHIHDDVPVGGCDGRAYGTHLVEDRRCSNVGENIHVGSVQRRTNRDAGSDEVNLAGIVVQLCRYVHQSYCRSGGDA